MEIQADTKQKLRKQTAVSQLDVREVVNGKIDANTTWEQLVTLQIQA